MALSPRQRSAALSTGRQRLTSYYGGQGPGRRSPFRQTKPEKTGRRMVHKAIDILLIMGVLAALFFSLSVKPSVRVEAANLPYRPGSDYAAVADQKLEALGNRDKITINDQAVVSAVKDSFPEVTTASLELPIFGQRPALHLNISPPVLELRSQSGSYVIDADGRAVGRTSVFPSIKNLSVVTDQSGFKVTTGQQALGSNSVQFIEVLLAQCRRAKVNVKSLTLPPADQELDLVTTDQPYSVKFYLGGDPLVQAGQFLAARHQFSGTHTQPVEYLDVRVSGKIFYK